MDTATYRIEYTDRTGKTRRPWYIANAVSAAAAVRSGLGSAIRHRDAAAAMYVRSGVCRSNETYGLLMTDGRESCQVVRQDREETR